MRIPEFGKLPERALAVSAALSENGFRHAVCGGWIRDSLFETDWSDVDIFVEGDCSDLAKGLGFSTMFLNRIFCSGDIQVVCVKSVESQVRSFDFTINCMALFPGGEFFDPCGALKDIKKRALRLNPCRWRELSESFRVEAPLPSGSAENFITGEFDNLVTRGCRFAARYGLAINPRTWELLKSFNRFKTYRQILESHDFKTSADLIKAMSENTGKFLDLFSRCALFGILFPELEKIRNSDAFLYESIITDALSRNSPKERIRALIELSFRHDPRRDELDLAIRLNEFRL